jgi:3'5'-cyclic nucleotide phosphodiesterase
VAPQEESATTTTSMNDHDQAAKKRHDHTYGITSDPLTRFALILSALWHDVDHAGVTNAQLVKEKAPVAQKFANKSVAEQNSIHLAWHLLLASDQYKDLRRVIYTTEDEFKRFRQLVVNIVLATDIMDQDLGALRKARWNKAFAAAEAAASAPSSISASSGTATLATATNSDNGQEDINRKATIVIEHLMQASDVSHTMQHWHVYRKWNQKLYDEMHQAFIEGRSGNNKDPSEFWYQGELNFLDFYVIPLAKKLKDCGVFGVSSAEYLSYAEMNRQEWESKGRAIVQELKEAAEKRMAEFSFV